MKGTEFLERHNVRAAPMLMGEYLRHDSGGPPALRQTWAYTLSRPDGPAGERRRFCAFVETSIDQGGPDWNEELFGLALRVRDDPLTFEQWVAEQWSPLLGSDPAAAYRGWIAETEMRGRLLVWLDGASEQLRRDFEEIDAP